MIFSGVNLKFYHLTVVVSILKMKSEKVIIKKIVNGSFGLSYLSSGQVLLVRGALPGETVDVEIEKTKNNYLFGKIKRVITPHKARRSAPCKYYNKCGGCDLQHCHDGAQLTLKKDILLDLMQRSSEADLQAAGDLLKEPIASPSSFNYRQRIRLQVDEHGRVGFRQFKSHKVVSIDKCLLAVEQINNCLIELKNLTDFKSLIPLTTEIELLLNPATNYIIILIHFNRKPRPANIEAARSIGSKIESVESIFFSGKTFPIMGPYRQEKKSPGKHLHISYNSVMNGFPPLDLCWEIGGFCQVNLQQNRQLINVVLDLCQLSRKETVLDLFCGMGNFSIPLARQAKHLIGIEGQGSSTRSAITNAQNNDLANTEFIKKPIHTGCKQLLLENVKFDCVVTDPPRQGMPGLAADLAALTKKRLVYISCDPATLCRDLADLLKKGFIIKKIQPVDMFPQTHHIETVVLLKKK